MGRPRLRLKEPTSRAAWPAASTSAPAPQLEERLQLGKSTVTELVLRSEKRGLVRRELDRNRRRGISIRLTPNGERRLAKALGELGDEGADLPGAVHVVLTAPTLAEFWLLLYLLVRGVRTSPAPRASEAWRTSRKSPTP